MDVLRLKEAYLNRGLGAQPGGYRSYEVRSKVTFLTSMNGMNSACANTSVLRVAPPTWPEVTQTHTPISVKCATFTLSC